MVSRKMFCQIYQHFIGTLILPNEIFARNSVLVFCDLFQLPTMRGNIYMQNKASSTCRLGYDIDNSAHNSSSKLRIMLDFMSFTK